MSKHCKNCGKLNINPLNKYCSHNCIIASGGNVWGSKRNPIKAVSDKKKARLAAYGTEFELFHKKIIAEIEEKGEIRCMNPKCKKLLHKEQLGPPSFPHLLSKKNYPAYRYFLNNLGIVCNDISMSSCHTKVDKILAGNKFLLEQKILNGERIEMKDFMEKDLQ